MDDPLKLLRQCNISNRPFAIRDQLVLVGDLRFRCDAKTSFRQYRVSDEQPHADDANYYSVGCVAFFLRHKNLKHAEYLRQSAQEKVESVSRADRKIFLEYLNGERDDCENIDKLAPLPTPVPRPSAPERVRPDARSSTVAAAKSTAAAANRLGGAPKSDIPISQERLAQLKAQRARRKRELAGGQSAANIVDSDLGQDERERELLAQMIARIGRQHNDRKTVLHIPGSSTDWHQAMQPYVLKLGRVFDGKSNAGGGGGGGADDATNSAALPDSAMKKVKVDADASYSRYDQERFTVHNTQSSADSQGFRIDPMATYHTMNLKAVREGNPLVSGLGAPSAPLSGSSAALAAQRRRAMLSKPPIIIIPNVTSALISILNAKDLLEELRFVSTEEKKRNGCTVDSDSVAVTRRNRQGQTAVFKVTNNPTRLAPDEFEARVVAAFVQGQTWQFKGWPWSSPAEIFTRIRGFHLKWDDMPLDKNVAKWNVHLIDLSRSKRHLDKAAMLKVWELIEKEVAKRQQLANPHRGRKS